MSALVSISKLVLFLKTVYSTYDVMTQETSLLGLKNNANTCFLPVPKIWQPCVSRASGTHSVGLAVSIELVINN